MPSFRQTWLPLGLVAVAAVAVGLHTWREGMAQSAVSVAPEQRPSELYQIGDQEYLAMNSGRRYTQIYLCPAQANLERLNCIQRVVDCDTRICSRASCV